MKYCLNFKSADSLLLTIKQSCNKYLKKKNHLIYPFRFFGASSGHLVYNFTVLPFFQLSGYPAGYWVISGRITGYQNMARIAG